MHGADGLRALQPVVTCQCIVIVLQRCLLTLRAAEFLSVGLVPPKLHIPEWTLNTRVLRCLTEELFTPDEVIRLRQVIETRPLKYAQVVEFDQSLGGPSIESIASHGLGRYEAADRDVFRPLE